MSTIARNRFSDAEIKEKQKPSVASSFDKSLEDEEGYGGRIHAFAFFSGLRPPKPGIDLAMQKLRKNKSPPSLPPSINLWRTRKAMEGESMPLHSSVDCVHRSPE